MHQSPTGSDQGHEKCCFVSAIEPQRERHMILPHDPPPESYREPQDQGRLSAFRLEVFGSGVI